MNNNNYSGMHQGAPPEIFRKARLLRNRMTEAELVVWDFLKYKPLGFKSRRQHPFGVYILDFYCHRKKLSIEIDGKYHLRNNQRVLDKERSLYIETSGIKELRFSNDMVIHNLDGVKDEILKEFQTDSPLGVGGK